MGTIKVRCANGHGLEVQAQYAGKRGKCPKCGAVVEVPQRAEPPTATAVASHASGASQGNGQPPAPAARPSTPVAVRHQSAPSRHQPAPSRHQSAPSRRPRSVVSSEAELLATAPPAAPRRPAAKAVAAVAPEEIPQLATGAEQISFHARRQHLMRRRRNATVALSAVVLVLLVTLVYVLTA